MEKGSEKTLTVDDLKAKTLNFNIQEPVDIDFAVKQLRGNMSLFIKILSRFEVLALKNKMKEIKEAVNSANWTMLS